MASKWETYREAKAKEVAAKKKTDEAFENLFNSIRTVYFRRQYAGPTYTGEIKDLVRGNHRSLLLRNMKTGTTYWVDESWLEIK